jgi:site-specific DNA-methyltransferase (adenine-specific)
MVIPDYTYYEDKQFTLLCGDCLDIIGLYDIETFDCIVADPPFFLSNGGLTFRDSKIQSVNKADWDVSRGRDELIKFTDNWLHQAKMALKADGTIWVMGTYHSIFETGYIMKNLGFEILNHVIYTVPNPPPSWSKRRFQYCTTSIIWARKPNGKHIFNYEVSRDRGFLKDLWLSKIAPPSERKFGKHPTQKSEDLLTRIILSSTKEGDLVLDPFTGSSTTGAVALRYGRRFVGIDTEESYLEISKKRLLTEEEKT